MSKFKGIQRIMKKNFPTSQDVKIALNLYHIKPKTFVNLLGNKPSYTNWNQSQPDNAKDPYNFVFFYA